MSRAGARAASDTIDCSNANYKNDNTDMVCVNPPYGAVNRVGSESLKGDARSADLGGNVAEWTLDSFGDYATPC